MRTAYAGRARDEHITELGKLEDPPDGSLRPVDLERPAPAAHARPGCLDQLDAPDVHEVEPLEIQDHQARPRAKRGGEGRREGRGGREVELAGENKTRSVHADVRVHEELRAPDGPAILACHRPTPVAHVRYSWTPPGSGVARPP